MADCLCGYQLCDFPSSAHTEWLHVCIVHSFQDKMRVLLGWWSYVDQRIHIAGLPPVD